MEVEDKNAANVVIKKKYFYFISLLKPLSQYYTVLENKTRTSRGRENDVYVKSIIVNMT